MAAEHKPVETEEQEATADELLLNQMQIAGYTIKKMSFGTLSRVTPAATKVIHRYDELFPGGITFDSRGIMVAALALMPELIPVIAAYFDVPEAEIAALDAQDGVALALAIWQMNTKLFLDFFVTCGSLARV